MSNMVASLRLKGKVDSSLTKALGKTDKDMARSARLAKRRARFVSRAAGEQARATSRAATETDRLGQSMGRASQRGRKLGQNLKRNLRHIKETRTHVKLLNKGLDGVANRWTGMAAGVGLGAAVYKVGALEESMVRLRNSSGATAASMREMKDKIYEAALKWRVAPERVKAAIQEYITKTGDFAGAKRQIFDFAEAEQSSGASGLDVGGVYAAGKTSMNISDGRSLWAMIMEQGKAGSVEAKDMAGYFPRTAAGYYSDTKRGGLGGAKEVGALMQAVNTVTNEVAVTSTTINAFSRDVLKNVKDLENLGVEVYSGETTKDGQRITRGLHEIAQDIVSQFGGDMEAILGSGIITDESKKLISAFMTEGGKGAFQAAFNVTDADAIKHMEDDAKRGADLINSSMAMLGGVWEKALEDYLLKPIQWGADAIGAIGPDAASAAVATGGVVAGVLGAAVAGRGLYRGYKGVKGFFSKGKAGGASKSGVGSLLGGMTGGVTPVEVINWPGGAFDLGGDAASGSGRRRKSRASRAGKAGRMGRFMRGGRGLFKGAGRLVGKAFRPLGMLMGAANLAGAVRSGSKSMMGRAAGSMAGGLGGGALGATLGTFLLPGIGTAVGGVLGSLIGDIIGEKTGEIAGKAMEAGATSSPALAAAPAGPPQIFHIHAAPGMDIEALAQKVATKVRRPGTGDLYDG